MKDTAHLNLTVDFEGAPAEIQVVPYGGHRTEKGDFILDEEGSALILKDFESRLNDMVIDYEHQTLGGGEAPAAGWIKKLRYNPPSPPFTKGGNGGIWAVVEWTDRAKQYLKNREYRYLSPVFLKRLSDNKVVRLLNAALTNQPAIDGMVPIVNKGAVPPANKGASSLESGKEDTMKRLLELLGLPETATGEEAVAAQKALVDRANAVASKEVLDALGLKEDASLSEVTGTLMAMKSARSQVSEISNLKSEIATLKSQLAKRDAEELVASAMKEGKVTPAQKDWAVDYAVRDPEGFKVFVSKAPAVVPMAEVAGATRSETGVAPLDEMQTAVNKALGISGETFKKYSS